MANLDRSVTLGVRVTPEDAKAIRDAAEEEGMSVSEYLRASSLAYMALSGRRYGMQMVLRGALRLGAEVGALVLARVRQLRREEAAR